jgi:2-iminobutanoate/2-iminopropanoate deaminase
MRTAIETDSAAAAIGPYSQAVRVGALLFVSGQIPLDPLTGDLVTGDITVQTDRVMRSIGAILEAAGTTFAGVARTTIYLVDLDDFAKVNEVYGSYFSPPAPARSTVQVARLPKGALVEIDVVASLTE